MKVKYFLSVLFIVSFSIFAQNKTKQNSVDDSGWLNHFDVKPENLSTTGVNTYFILKPGYQLILKGKEDNQEVTLTITVLNETNIVNGYNTRVVEEREEKGGQLIEVSKNYFAIDNKSKNVYYFGEAVDIYKNGKIEGHPGSWEAGKNTAKFGLAIPGNIKIGEKYYQEIAPNIAMDRAQILSDKVVYKTLAGNFISCLKTEETTPIEPKLREYKIYAPGVGLIKDDTLTLVKYGY